MPQPYPSSDKRPTPPSMNRSRVQVATKYAPGVLFTFEGGRGICLSVPIANPKMLAPSRAKLVFDGMTEFLQTWLKRARAAISPDVDPELCIDRCFIAPETADEIRVDRVAAFELTEPAVVGYEPFPLLFQCPGCSRLYESESISALAKAGTPRPCSCGIDDWRQVDVVFAHWSGEIAPLSPLQIWWNDHEQRIERFKSCTCGNNTFILVNRSPVFSEWRFRCTACGETKDVVQRSRLALGRLMPLRGRAGVWRDPIALDWNMLPVSYRASSLHYVQSGRFIAIDGSLERSWLELFAESKEPELLREVARIHRFAMEEPSLEEIRDALLRAHRKSDWQGIEQHRAACETVRRLPGGDKLLKDLEASLRNALAELARQGAIPLPTVKSAALSSQLRRQAEWSRRRNPFRLTVEHAAFYDEHIRDKVLSRRAVDLCSPDRQLFQHAELPDALAEYRSEVEQLLGRLGVEELVLVRNLPVVEYTFGFTRVSPTPVYERAQANGVRPMPVRLCAFPRMYGGKRPVYVLEQENEALYFRLREADVVSWLGANGIQLPAGDAAQTLGAAFLETYEDFGEFLDAYGVRLDGATPRGVANYVYSLLHSMCHAIIHSLADLSGLDTDGIGEQIYPPDLSFVVYRKGMTPDLGNVSGMWRNRHRQFLEGVVSARSLRCGSGSLCDLRGGACPACIMTPDVACIAHNQLLSRAMLAGGPPPAWEPLGASHVVGFFEVCGASPS